MTSFFKTYRKFIGFYAMAGICQLAKFYCLIKVIIEVVREVFRSAYHPVLYYVLWIGLIISFSKLQSLFQRSALNERPVLS